MRVDERKSFLEEFALVGQRGEIVLGGKDPQRVLGRRLEPLDRDLVQSNPVGRAAPSAKHDGAVPHCLDLLLSEIVEPTVEGGFVLLLRIARERAQPACGVGEGIVRAVVEQPRIAADSADPVTKRLGPLISLSGRVHPADEDVREGAFCENFGDTSHDVAAKRIPRLTTVAVREGRVGRDHIWRIRHDQTEALAFDGLEKVAVTELDDVDAVERGVESGKGERSLVHVGGDDMGRVLRRQQRLDPAAGSEIQRRIHRPAKGELRKSDRRRVDACHPVGEGLGGNVVGGEVVVAVGKESHRGPDAITLPLQEPECRDAVESDRRKGCVDEGSLDPIPEQEEPRDRRESVVSGEAAAVDRGLSRGGGELSHAQRGVDALSGEVSAFEHRAEVRERLRVGDRRCRSPTSDGSSAHSSRGDGSSSSSHVHSSAYPRSWSHPARRTDSCLIDSSTG